MFDDFENFLVYRGFSLDSCQIHELRARVECVNLTIFLSELRRISAGILLLK